MDQLFDVRRLRALTLVDNYTREFLVIDIALNLRGDNVVATLAAEVQSDTLMNDELVCVRLLKPIRGPTFS